MLLAGMRLPEPWWPQSVRPDLAKFHHFDQYLKIFGNIFKVYLVLGNFSAHFGTISMLLGKFSLLKMAKY